MIRNLKLLAIVGLLALPQPLLAQSDTTQESGELPATGTELPGGLALGQTETNTGVGSTYLKEVEGDWDLQCIRAPEGQADPCEMVQLLKEANGNPVVEMRIFALPAGGQAVAGATVITPLETLLTEPLRIGVDGGAAKRYPYSWCSKVGCVSRLGLTAEDIAGFKRGAQGTLTIVPAAAPDQKVELPISLTGFTAAWGSLEAPALVQQ